MAKHVYNGELKGKNIDEQLYLSAIIPYFIYKGAEGFKRDLPRMGLETSRKAARKVVRLTGELDDWALRKYNKVNREVFRLTGKINDYPVNLAKGRMKFYGGF